MNATRLLLVVALLPLCQSFCASGPIRASRWRGRSAVEVEAKKSFEVSQDAADWKLDDDGLWQDEESRAKQERDRAAAEQRRAAPKRAVRPMELYLKAGPEGNEIGDCPFAHYVRMVLAEKGIEYVAKPCVQETKPQWLVDGYGGSMPALLHDGEVMWACGTRRGGLGDTLRPTPPADSCRAPPAAL